MSRAFNLLNDLGERHTRRRLLTIAGHINKNSKQFSPSAARDVHVYRKTGGSTPKQQAFI